MIQTKRADLGTLMSVRRLTLDEVSARTGIHSSRLSRLLNGRETLTEETHRLIERAIWQDLIAVGEEATSDSAIA